MSEPAALPVAEEWRLLSEGQMRVVGLLRGASNVTMLVRLRAGQLEGHAVYKPQLGEQPLWDFPPGTLCQREVAAYEVSQALGWDIVPPTLLRNGPQGRGSVQLFVPHDPRAHYFSLVEDEAWHPQLLRLATFDVLVNNADRKASHVLRDSSGVLLGCDHGLAFHADEKLRTVIWDFAGEAVPDGLLTDVRRLAHDLRRGAGVRARLTPLLSPGEIDALAQRAETLIDLPELPLPPAHARAYPWPLL